MSMNMLNLIAKTLNIDESEMVDLFEKRMQSMRMNYYPPCPEPHLAIGLTPHSRSNRAHHPILQVNNVDGLQIHNNGSWVPIKPLPEALIVNIGDVLEIFSNGTYKNIEHRATVQSEVERISIATFLFPRLDGELGPAKSLTYPRTGTLPQFRNMSVTDYFKRFFGRELDGKSNVELMRIRDSTEECR